MAYNNNSVNRSARGARNDYYATQNRQQQGTYAKPAAEEIRAEILPEDYVDLAEKIMAEQYRNITTSKLRNFLALISDIYNVEKLSKDKDISEQSLAKLNMMRVRVAYECGRDGKNLKNFVLTAKLLNYIKGIGTDRSRLINFAHYLEALVAYHRYYGGREN